jgi:hypothetical protein
MDDVESIDVCWPKDVAVPMNCGGRSSHALLKLSPSPKEGILYWSAVMSSKNEVRNRLSWSDNRGAPGGGSGGSWSGPSFGLTLSVKPGSSGLSLKEVSNRLYSQPKGRKLSDDDFSSSAIL